MAYYSFSYLFIYLALVIFDYSENEKLYQYVWKSLEQHFLPELELMLEDSFPKFPFKKFVQAFSIYVLMISNIFSVICGLMKRCSEKGMLNFDDPKCLLYSICRFQLRNSFMSSISCRFYIGSKFMVLLVVELLCGPKYGSGSIATPVRATLVQGPGTHREADLGVRTTYDQVGRF